MRVSSLVKIAVVVGLCAGSAACRMAPPVKPWQRGHLAKRAMRFDASLSETLFRQHLFSSREGADGGSGQVGGGCGCN